MDTEYRLRLNIIGQ